MSRPKLLTIGKTLYWAIRVFNSSGVLIDADSSPTVAVRKNGSVTGDSVTVTKRSATTGIYDCSYNPAAEVEGDSFEIEETVTISAVAYANDAWVCQVIAVERGTDSVDVSGIVTTVSDISDRIPSALENGAMICYVESMGAGVLTAAATDSDFVTMIQSGLATSAALTIVAGYLDTEIAAIKVVTDKVDTMLILDGVVYQLTANALELSPSTTVNITPAFARQDAMIEANTITIRKGTQGWILVTILDENDDPVNLTVYTGLKFLVSVPGATSLQEQTVNVIGTNNNQFYWKPNVASTSKERSLVWSLVNDIVDESSQYYKASPADGIILVKDTAVL